VYIERVRFVDGLVPAQVIAARTEPDPIEDAAETRKLDGQLDTRWSDGLVAIRDPRAKLRLDAFLEDRDFDREIAVDEQTSTVRTRNWFGHRVTEKCSLDCCRPVGSLTTQHCCERKRRRDQKS
jgi:hypothetical protein